MKIFLCFAFYLIPFLTPAQFLIGQVKEQKSMP